LVLPFIGLPSISFESSKRRPGGAQMMKALQARRQPQFMNALLPRSNAKSSMVSSRSCIQLGDRPPREKHVHAYPNADSNQEIQRLELALPQNRFSAEVGADI
jgi:hypothetical protein